MNLFSKFVFCRAEGILSMIFLKNCMLWKLLSMNDEIFSILPSLVTKLG